MFILFYLGLTVAEVPPTIQYTIQVLWIHLLITISFNFALQDLCEYQIDETFRIPELGTVVGGLLLKGIVREGSELMLGLLKLGNYKHLFLRNGVLLYTLSLF